MNFMSHKTRRGVMRSFQNKSDRRVLITLVIGAFLLSLVFIFRVTEENSLVGTVISFLGASAFVWAFMEHISSSEVELNEVSNGVGLGTRRKRLRNYLLFRDTKGQLLIKSAILYRVVVMVCLLFGVMCIVKIFWTIVEGFLK